MSKYGGKRHFIYLAGSISSDKRTYQWREIFTDLVKCDEVVVLNPCNTQFNKRLHTNGPWSINTVAESAGKHLLKPKDFVLIKKASLMILNLDYYTVDKPLVGSIIEFEWAVRWFGIPVIVICKNPGNPYVLHPWIEHDSSAIVKDIREAADLVQEFFL